MKTKQELMEQINLLPLFEKKEVKVNCGDAEWVSQDKHQAIVEKGKTQAVCYVGEKYQLIQFKDVFGPVLDNIQEEGSGYLCNYGGYASLKIFPERDDLKSDEGQFGLIAANSVDLSSSVIVKFCVKRNDFQFTIPSKVAGLRKQHTGKTINLVKNYMSLIGKVKESWKRIVDEFPKYRIVINENEAGPEEKYLLLGTLTEKLKLGTRMTKKVKEEYEKITLDGKRYTLWDVLLKIIEQVSDGKYKSDSHKERKIDQICKTIFDYSLLLSL